TTVISTPPPGIVDSVLQANAAGDLTVVSLTGLPDAPGPSAGAAVRGLARWGSLILAVTDASVEAMEWGLDGGDLPFTSPLGPVFVGGYARLDLNPSAIGVANTDVEVIVEKGPLAGTVSAGLEPPAVDGQLRLMLLAAWT